MPSVESTEPCVSGPALQRGWRGLGRRDHRAVPVLEGDLPVGPQPAELPVHPHAEPGRMADRLVFLAAMGEIDVADSIVAVEGEEELAVAERNVPRHAGQFAVAKAASFGWPLNTATTFSAAMTA